MLSDGMSIEGFLHERRVYTGENSFKCVNFRYIRAPRVEISFYYDKFKLGSKLVESTADQYTADCCIIIDFICTHIKKVHMKEESINAIELKLYI